MGHAACRADRLTPVRQRRVRGTPYRAGSTSGCDVNDGHGRHDDARRRTRPTRPLPSTARPMMKPCLDCGTPAHGNRCPEHAATHKQRGQARHQQRRAERGGPRTKGGASRGGVGAGAVCWLCGKPATLNDPMQWDHLIPVREGGQNAGVLPAHRSCNIRRHHDSIRQERVAAARDEVDRRLRRGRHALGTGGEGADPIPPSNPARRDAK